MATHISNFGNAGAKLEHLADRDGFLPQAGDKPEDFDWLHDEFTCDFDSNGDGWVGFAAEEWAAHVAKCEAEIADATSALAAWREGGE